MLVAKGRRTLEWSRGLRAELLPDLEERAHAEIAAESDEGTPVVALAPTAWREVVAASLTVAVLQAVKGPGLPGGGRAPGGARGARGRRRRARRPGPTAGQLLAAREAVTFRV
jgi:hypothetical protein